MARTATKRVEGPNPDAEDELNNRLFFRLIQAGNIYERKAQNELGYSAIQGALLGALSRDRAAGVPLSDLVEYLAVSRQNLDGVLKRLEKLGLVERIDDPANRRVRRVRLTAAGEAAWAELFAHSLDFYRQGSAGVSMQAKAALADTLAKIIRGLRSIDLGLPADAKPVGHRAGTEAAGPGRGSARRRATAAGGAPAKRHAAAARRAALNK
jgi:DNA-binding MarR family transcriptional regulator